MKKSIYVKKRKKMRPKKKFSISEKINTTHPHLTAEFEKIKRTLKQQYDVNIRDDSHLVWNYLTSLPHDIIHEQQVCRELWYLKLLYNYTPYEQICKTQLPVIKSFLIYNYTWYPFHHKQAQDHIREFVLFYIQLRCMYDGILKTGMTLRN
jgi:hypothetical protein